MSYEASWQMCIVVSSVFTMATTHSLPEVQMAMLIYGTGSTRRDCVSFIVIPPPYLPSASVMMVMYSESAVCFSKDWGNPEFTRQLHLDSVDVAKE